MGTHDIYLTGNILVPEDNPNDEDLFDSDDDEDYDLPPDEDELDYDLEEDESDELDDIDDPRITEVDTDEEAAAPQLVKAEPTAAKGKNKRARDDSEIETPEKPSIDSTLSKSLKPAVAEASEEEQKLSKSQLKKMRKKMKDNAGNAVETNTKEQEDRGTKQEITTGKSDKKVQFAKTLVQGPSGASQPNGDAAKAKVPLNDAAPQTNGNSKGPRVVQGVTIDDRKLGSGPAAKKGDNVSMRYIGKLDSNKKVFDGTIRFYSFLFPKLFSPYELENPRQIGLMIAPRPNPLLTMT